MTVQWDPHVIATALGPYISGLKIDTVSIIGFDVSSF